MALPAPVDPRRSQPAGPVTPRVLPKPAPDAGICVVIPCLNEAATIGTVVTDFRRVLPRATVIVFDNSSTDESAQLAEAAGAIVVRVPRQGKGYVLRHAFDRVKANVYVVVDADATYPADRVMDLIAPVLAGEADMVVGSREHFLEPDAIRPLHQWGNRLIVSFLNLCFGTRLRDILSGYRVLSGEMVRELPLLAPGFEVETELTLETLERGFRVLEVPVQYRRRPEGSQSKLSSFKDGYRILLTIMTLLRDYRPMTFFTVLASVIALLSLTAGAVVLTDYVRTGLVPRLPLAVLSAAMMLLAAVFFVTGFVVSAINRRFAEMTALARRWREDQLTRDVSA